MMGLGPKGMRALELRGISVETASRFGLYTARSDADGVVPDLDGNIVAFPFLENGQVVAEKYRAPNKRFWQKAGDRKTFWNADVLDDPALAEGRMPLIVVEGEIDALTAIECGFPLTVSVPDGAPGKAADDADYDPLKDQTGKFQFVWNNKDRLRAIKRFVIAVDNDGPGEALAHELVRRLGASRCAFVTYPEGCKDLNDVLRRHGSEGVARVINTAKPYPVFGLYKLSDFPPAKPIHPVGTGWPTLDQHFRPFPGAFAVAIGIPSHGKTTVILNLLVNLAQREGWRSAVFSPEMPVVPYLRDKLRRIYAGAHIARLTDAEVAEADAFIDDAFVFIGADPTTGEQEEDFSLEWLVAKAEDAVIRHGVNVLLIDPWNEVEHAKRPSETMTEYIGRGIRMLKRFAQQFGVMVIVIVHPTKEVGKDGVARMPTLYDADGSAHFYNKPDFGIVVHRDGESNQTIIRMSKVRFDETGKKGEVRMQYDLASCRFKPLDDGAGEMPASDYMGAQETPF